MKKYRQLKNIKNISTETLIQIQQQLREDSKSYEDTGAYLTKLNFGPLVAGIVFACIHFVPGLIVSAVFGSMLLTGCVFTVKSVKCDELLKKVNKELEKRPEQLAMEEFLKETYNPTLVKRTQTKNIEKENNDEFGL